MNGCNQKNLVTFHQTTFWSFVRKVFMLEFYILCIWDLALFEDQDCLQNHFENWLNWVCENENINALERLLLNSKSNIYLKVELHQFI